MSVEKYFIDRVEVSSTMMKRVEAFNRGYRQNVGILGEPYIGKSSLLREFVLAFPHQNIIPIYIEVSPEPFDYFAKKFMGTVLHSFIRTSGLLIPDSFDGLVKRTRKYLPQTLKQMRTIRLCIQNKDIIQAFGLLLTLTDTLAKDTGRKIILIIDEFDSMEQFAIKDMFTILSHAIMVQTETMYVVSSSHAERAENIFREKLSLLFGNFETLRVLPFNFNESAQFIAKVLSGISIDPLYVKFLIRLTDGHPYYLNLIVLEMKRMLNHPTDSIHEHDIVDALAYLLFNKSGALHQHFLLKLNRFYKSCNFYVYVNVLVAISEGMRKINAIARFVEKDKEETKKVLQRLHEEKLIERSGYFYVIPDSLLKFWLRYVYARKITALGVSDGCDENRFRHDVSDLVDSSCHEEYKELNKRVEELLRSFNNDVVEINTKRMKCPSFHEVYLRPTNGRIYPLYAKSNSTRWLCQVAQMKVEEEDIQILVNDSKKMRKKVNKRVLITPHGISLNAKLMAKQEKIDIWNLRNLNFIFDLYDKPKIIV